MPHRFWFLIFLAAIVPITPAQETHDHGIPEKLGKVSFPISCAPDVQDGFNRGVALLHSFAYSAAQSVFQSVATRDPQCAMAHWGLAMTYFHQLWEPPVSPVTAATAEKEVRLAEQIGAGTEREHRLILALGLIFDDANTVPYTRRISQYANAMRVVASQNKGDVETQVFYALALLASASPADKTHVNQKQAADLLEPLFRAYPQHPGIAHYLIHACDNEEMANRGLAPARAYSRIAPSAPHALHMPSHIFTRLGLWNDSIHSNLAAAQAAQSQGDSGEELHAMDYLVYAYLQLGRYPEASRVIARLKQMRDLDRSDFKSAYAFTAMPIRYDLERGNWSDAAVVVPPEDAPPQVVSVALWARGLGLARTGHPEAARTEIESLRGIGQRLHEADEDYWAKQVGVQILEVEAWSAQASNKPAQALQMLRQAADEEDATEKLPVTPGPIIPAREQLGSLLLEQNKPVPALGEFQTALSNAPGRRGAALGASRAQQLSRSDSSRSSRSGPGQSLPLH